MAQPTDRSVLISQGLCYYDALGPAATNHKLSVIIFLNSGSQSVSNHGPFWEESAFSHLFPMHSAWAGHGSWPPPASGCSTDEFETVFSEVLSDDTVIKRGIDSALPGAMNIVGSSYFAKCSRKLRRTQELLQAAGQEAAEALWCISKPKVKDVRDPEQKKSVEGCLAVCA